MIKIFCPKCEKQVGSVRSAMIPEKGGLVTCPECAVKILVKKDGVKDGVKNGVIEGIWKKTFSIEKLFSEIILCTAFSLLC
ncbi:MAG: hypothetical protein L3V56_13320 [Candidatus Magnetoovum sp. WYHC-5]|nr:hypothetical protein [Candidatus Magnetoovum sp. WYHC-5]